VVVLDDVTVRFGRTTALRGVCLQVGGGERVGVLGPSGAGKSTLLALLNGTVAATEGTVRVLGQRPDLLSAKALRRLRARIGTVSQSLDLVGPLRVVHNVNAGRLAQWSLPRAAWSLLRPQGVDLAVAALGRVGIADRVFDRCDELSGGQQQRVAMARLLVQDAELLLADEPVSSLDPGLAAHVLGLLVGLADEGATLLASLHDPALAVRFCDRLVGLRDGRVQLDVAASELPPGALDELYAAQR
jgi:phosphonate transport system ATP-binding protein